MPGGSVPSMGIGFKLEVDPHSQKMLERLLRDLGPEVQNRISGSAVNYGAGAILSEARRRARRYGWKHVPKALGKRKKAYPRAGVQHVSIGPKDATWNRMFSGEEIVVANIAHLLAFGTRPHSIKGTARHPGSRPHPFMGPAFAAKGPEALKRYRKKLWQGVVKYARKRGLRVGMVA